MLLQTFRFLSVMLTALILGPAFCHMLEMPAKMALSPADYLTVQQIYTRFGPVGSILEPGAIVCAIVLTVLVRRSRAFVPALLGALCLVAALVSWFAIVNPVNPHWVAAATPTVPPDFTALRDRWEWGHAAHAALLFSALVALVISVLVQAPARATTTAAGRSTRARAA